MRLSKKVSPSLTKGMHPAAAHSLSVKYGQFARLRGEKCFLRRTCRRRKRISMSSRLRARTLRGFFDTLRNGIAEAMPFLFVVRFDAVPTLSGRTGVIWAGRYGPHRRCGAGGGPSPRRPGPGTSHRPPGSGGSHGSCAGAYWHPHGRGPWSAWRTRC